LDLQSVQKLIDVLKSMILVYDGVEKGQSAIKAADDATAALAGGKEVGGDLDTKLELTQNQLTTILKGGVPESSQLKLAQRTKAVG
jgi:hypothetical protein